MPVDSAAVRNFMSRRDPFIHPTVMFRRSFFERCGFYNEAPGYSYLEDTELWSRAILAGCQGANIPEYLFDFRVNPGFVGRRRGLRFVFNELFLRCRYVFKARLPLYHLALPAAVSLIRLSPARFTKFAYRRLRY
jgi:hypothetical protein